MKFHPILSGWSFYASTDSVMSNQIPDDARNNAWVSFDGKRRQQLSRGDSVRIAMSQHPLPTVNKSDQTGDWFRSLIRCLNWNERKDQKALWHPELIPYSTPSSLRFCTWHTSVTDLRKLSKTSMVHNSRCSIPFDNRVLLKDCNAQSRGHHGDFVRFWKQLLVELYGSEANTKPTK